MSDSSNPRTPSIPAAHMSKALLVDFGGVLTRSVFESFAAFARAEGVDPAVMMEAMRASFGRDQSIFVRVEAGEIDTAEFEVAFADEIGRQCGVVLNPVGLKARLFAGAGADEAMLAVVRAARARGVKTALVSNSWGVTDGGYPLDDFDTLFDAAIISGEVRLRKPHPEIFLLAAERVGVPPQECVFLDDLAENVEGARAVGMTAIHHRSADETIPLLEQKFGFPLR